MKKVLSAFLFTLLFTAVLILPIGARAGSYDEAEFVQEFLTDGKLTPPSDLYLVVGGFDGSSNQCVDIYFTQSDDIMRLISAYNACDDDEAFNAKYGVWLWGNELRTQFDCKVDDGDWHYNPDWDDFNYDGSDMPGWMCFKADNNSWTNVRTVKAREIFDLYYMEEDKSDWGFLKNAITIKDGHRGLDTDDHTFTIRARSYLDFEKTNADGYTTSYRIFSDWSDEASFGKKGSQVELKAPTGKLEAPVFTDIRYLDGRHDDDGYSECSWDVFWMVPDSVYDDIKYYWAVEDRFEPVSIDAEYRVNGGEWISVIVANAADIYGGWRGFVSLNSLQDDDVEFRARYCYGADESRTSDWSGIISSKNGYTAPEKPVQTGKTESGKAETVTETAPAAEKTACRLCGKCPVQPLGICLFIWILVGLLILIIVVSIIKSSLKKKQKKVGFLTAIKIVLILAMIVVLLIFIKNIIVNKAKNYAKSLGLDGLGSITALFGDDKDSKKDADNNAADGLGGLGGILSAIQGGDVSNYGDLDSLINGYAEDLAKQEMGDQAGNGGTDDDWADISGSGEVPGSSDDSGRHADGADDDYHKRLRELTEEYSKYTAESVTNVKGFGFDLDDMGYDYCIALLSKNAKGTGFLGDIYMDKDTETDIQPMLSYFRSVAEEGKLYKYSEYIWGSELVDLEESDCTSEIVTFVFKFKGEVYQCELYGPFVDYDDVGNRNVEFCKINILCKIAD